MINTLAVYDTLSTLSIISFIIAGVSLIAAIFLFVYFKIPDVIGDLSGKNAKKSIARLREHNEKSGNKSFRPSETNAQRGKVTSTVPGITTGPKPTAGPAAAAQGRPAPQTPVRQAPAQAGPGFVPRTPNDMPETGLLGQNRTEDVGEGTDLLYDPNSTVLLAETPKEPPKRVGGVAITPTEKIMFIHTEEVIE